MAAHPRVPEFHYNLGSVLQKYEGLTGQDARNLQTAQNLIAELKNAH